MKRPGLKRQLITLWRICVSGFRNLFRNLWLTTAGVAIMTVTLTIVLSSVVANLALQETIDDVAVDLTISIFVRDDAKEEKVESLERVLRNNEYVTNVNYKSKQVALSEFQDRFADRPELLQGISITENNVFPASFEVSLNNVERFDEVVSIANSEQFQDVVLDTSDNEKSRQSFTGFINAKNFITRASIVAGSIFAAISVLIIFNTIRMAIFTRSSEIEIMKLIGATPGYIRGPFLFEASCYGIVAGLLSLSIVYSALLALADRLGNSITMEETMAFFTDYWYLIFGVTIGIGMLIGFMSSVVAMAKYLRLKLW